jgi:hypothetical protein
VKVEKTEVSEELITSINTVTIGKLGINLAENSNRNTLGRNSNSMGKKILKWATRV